MNFRNENRFHCCGSVDWSFAGDGSTDAPPSHSNHSFLLQIQFQCSSFIVFGIDRNGIKWMPIDYFRQWKLTATNTSSIYFRFCISMAFEHRRHCERTSWDFSVAVEKQLQTSSGQDNANFTLQMLLCVVLQSTQNRQFVWILGMNGKRWIGRCSFIILCVATKAIF